MNDTVPAAGGSGILLVTPRLQGLPSGGRALLSRLLHDALFNIFGSGLTVFELEPIRLAGLATIRGTLRGHIDGLDAATIDRILSMIQHGSIGKVFIDGSNLGSLAAAIKGRSRGVEVVSFFHNCEARFFLGALRERPSVHAVGVLLANWMAEKRAVRYSDKLVCLSERDSAQLRRLYGRAATHISPMAMHDRLPTELPPPQASREPYALFVGGTFYANRQGIDWFVEHVAARAPIKTRVVGRGFEQWKERLERNGNVEVVGSVDSLVPWYLGARFVIAPIFDGSGMKTKVAEALMFGKRVVGTPEAFSGYEIVADRAGTICETPDQFLAAMTRETQLPFIAVAPELRAIYEDRYSFHAACERIGGVLGPLAQ